VPLRTNSAVGDVTLIRKVSVESPLSVRFFFVRLIEFTEITFNAAVLVMVVVPVMSSKVWVGGRPAICAERARTSASSRLKSWLLNVPRDVPEAAYVRLCAAIERAILVPATYNEATAEQSDQEVRKMLEPLINLPEGPSWRIATNSK